MICISKCSKNSLQVKRRFYCFSRDLQSIILGDYSLNGLWLPRNSFGDLIVQIRSPDLVEKMPCQECYRLVFCTPSFVGEWMFGRVPKRWEALFSPTVRTKTPLLKRLLGGNLRKIRESLHKKTGSTIRTLLHGKINPKDWQVSSLGDVGFLLFFRVVSGDYGKPWKRWVFLGWQEFYNTPDSVFKPGELSGNDGNQFGQTVEILVPPGVDPAGSDRN